MMGFNRALGDSILRRRIRARNVERDEHGRVKALGYVLRFGDWSLYHSGDTLRYEGMAEKLRPFAVDVALLPINGRAPERRVAGNLSGPEAAQLARHRREAGRFPAISICLSSTRRLRMRSRYLPPPGAALPHVLREK
jgi:hypothetical protein